MGDHDETEELRRELAAMRARVDELEAREAPAAKPPVSRRGLLMGLAGAGAAAVAGIASAEPASADTGDGLVLGTSMTTGEPTTITMDSGAQDGAHGATLVGYNRTNAEGMKVPDLPEVAQVGLLGVGFEGVRGVGSFNGVIGESASGVGVAAIATGPGGGAFWGQSVMGPTISAQSGDGVTLRLEPSGQVGPPGHADLANFAYQVGSISIDSSGDVWLCTAQGNPGTWTRLLREDKAPVGSPAVAGRTIPITPIRVLDTRTTNGQAAGGPLVPGQVKGPLKGGQFIALDLAGIGAIPDDATGVVGNLVALTPNHTGYVRVQPAGAATAAGSVNFNKGEAAASNAFTSGLASGALGAVVGGGATNTTHLVVDITAYIT